MIYFRWILLHELGQIDRALLVFQRAFTRLENISTDDSLLKPLIIAVIEVQFIKRKMIFIQC